MEMVKTPLLYFPASILPECEPHANKHAITPKPSAHKTFRKLLLGFGYSHGVRDPLQRLVSVICIAPSLTSPSPALSAFDKPRPRVAQCKQPGTSASFALVGGWWLLMMVPVDLVIL